jgi:hypothetical protein
MRHLFVIIIFAISFTANPIYAGQDEYDDCLLRHLINAKVDLATQIMKRACKENFKDVRILSEERKEYNECLLEYLPGVESGDAVIEIQEVCERKHL